jgi:hypothetical protein
MTSVEPAKAAVWDAAARAPFAKDQRGRDEFASVA